MQVLLVSGLGPTLKNSDYLAGSMLDRETGPANTEAYLRPTRLAGFGLDKLAFQYHGETYPLLRPRYYNVPHLTTFAVREIIERAGHAADLYDTAKSRAD